MKPAEENISRQIVLAPNPTRNAFSLSVKDVAPGEMLRLQIINASGALEKDVCIANGSLIPVVFKPGLYICRVYVSEVPVANVVKLVIIP